MKWKLATVLVSSLVALPVLAAETASGDAAAGEKAFRKCKACHSIVDAEGKDIVKGGKAGPNLWGVPGRTAGTYDGFRYKKSIFEAGEGGLTWDQANFVIYVQDPKAFLKEITGDGNARAGMTFNLRKEEDAVNIWAFLMSVSPEPGS